MGSGKGAPEYWVAVVRPGRILFEIGGTAPDLAKQALHLASYKLPIRCQVVKRAGLDESQIVLAPPNPDEEETGPISQTPGAKEGGLDE